MIQAAVYPQTKNPLPNAQRSVGALLHANDASMHTCRLHVYHAIATLGRPARLIMVRCAVSTSKIW
jgi:hypothetical protein